MTGFGEAQNGSEELSLSVEVRTLNNRHLKVSVRGSEPYPMLEPELEKIVRRYVRRGSVSIHVRRQHKPREQDFAINAVALKSYLTQIAAVCRELGQPERIDALAGQILSLPGVVALDSTPSSLVEGEWALAERTLADALERVQQMRRDEGKAMSDELLQYRRDIAAELEKLRQHVPKVGEGYRKRLQDRLNHTLREAGVRIEMDQLIREVALFADRSDVAEEITRLASHLEQFAAIVTTESDGPGKKLEFVTQEMGREANTIGSKAGDVTVSRHVVEIKATLEKIRELLQNVE